MNNIKTCSGGVFLFVRHIWFDLTPVAPAPRDLPRMKGPTLWISLIFWIWSYIPMLLSSCLNSASIFLYIYASNPKFTWIKDAHKLFFKEAPKSTEISVVQRQARRQGLLKPFLSSLFIPLTVRELFKLLLLPNGWRRYGLRRLLCAGSLSKVGPKFARLVFELSTYVELSWILRQIFVWENSSCLIWI